MPCTEVSEIVPTKVPCEVTTVGEMPCTEVSGIMPAEVPSEVTDGGVIGPLEVPSFDVSDGGAVLKVPCDGEKLTPEEITPPVGQVATVDPVDQVTTLESLDGAMPLD